MARTTTPKTDASKSASTTDTTTGKAAKTAKASTSKKKTAGTKAAASTKATTTRAAAPASAPATSATTATTAAPAPTVVEDTTPKRPTHTNHELGLPSAVEGEPGVYTVDYGVSINQRKEVGDAETGLRLPEGYAALRVDLVYEGVEGEGITRVIAGGPDGTPAFVSKPTRSFDVRGLIDPGGTLTVGFATAPGTLPATQPGQKDTERTSRGTIFLRATPIS